jgi:hypothetical protein
MRLHTASHRLIVFLCCAYLWTAPAAARRLEQRLARLPVVAAGAQRPRRLPSVRAAHVGARAERVRRAGREMPESINSIRPTIQTLQQTPSRLHQDKQCIYKMSREYSQYFLLFFSQEKYRDSVFFQH